MKNLNSSVFSSLFLILAQSLTLFLGSSLIAKSLSLEDTASWFLIAALAPIINFFDFGASVFVTREVPVLRKKADSSQSLGHLSKTLRLFFIFASGLFCFLSFLVVQALIHFHFLPEHFLVPLILYISGCLFRLLANLNFAFVFGYECVGRERLLKAGLFLFYLFCLFYVYNFEPTLGRFVFSWFLFGVLSLIVSEFALRSVMPRETGRFRVEVLHQAFSSGMTWIGNSLPALAISSFQVFIVGYFWTSTEVKEIGLLQQILLGIVTLSSMPAMIFGPRLAALSSQGSVESYSSSVFAVLKQTALIGLLGLSFFTIFYQDLFRIWVGEAVTLSVLTIFVFSFFALLECLNTSVMSSLWYIQKFDILKFTVKSALLVLVFSFVFTPQLGLLGVFLAGILGQSIFSYRNNSTYLIFSLGQSKRKIRNEIVAESSRFLVIVAFLFYLISCLPFSRMILLGIGTFVAGLVFVFINWKFKQRLVDDVS